jgi:transcriptional regulator with XRE-family HTH domain
MSLTPESKLRNKGGTPGGNRLRALREYRGRTQLDVELDASLGTGYLQRVESGKVRHPERDTLERILGALTAQYTERRDILELFGYVVDAPLPDEAEISWAIAACQNDLDSAVFPAYLLDCTHRPLTKNSLASRLFPIPAFHSERVSMMRIIFDPTLGITPWIANQEVFFPAQIRAMRYEMALFRGETWATAVLDDLLRYPVFVHYWSQADSIALQPTAARPLSPLEIDLPHTGRLQFRLLAEPFVSDRRFRVVYCLPAEPVTMEWCLG